MTSRILVVAPSWLGDLVMAKVLTQALAKRSPQPIIELLAPPLYKTFIESFAEVSHFIPNPCQHGEFGFWKRWSLAQQLKQRAFDEAIILPNAWKAALPPFLANIPKRVGYRGEQRFLLLNDLRPPSEEERLVDRYHPLAFPRNAPNTPIENPTLIVPSEGLNAILSRLQTDPRPKIAICPGAEYGPAKRWPPGYFATLCNLFLSDGYLPIVLGSPKEQSIGLEIQQQVKEPLWNWIGNTSLREAVQIIAHCALTVANDSGLMHVAAALNTPTLGLFGSSSERYTPPLGQSAQAVFHPNVSCRPCFKRHCPLEHQDCLKKLLPQDIYHQAKQLMLHENLTH